VGATYPQQLKELRLEMPHTFFLVPGYGAQGGGGADVAGAFDANGAGAIVNSSRGLIAAWQKEGCAAEDFAGAARREALRMKEDITKYL
jgi:orotidine-5'-phosphate decarboxylase